MPRGVSQPRPRQPRPAEGDERHRELPHGGARRACRALRGLRAHTIAYNSCRNRHCPKCQGAAAREWMAEREAELLPVPYFHVVFTLPSAIGDIAYQNKAVIYDLLFKASSETHAHDRGRPEASRRPHRHHRGAAHLGLGHDPSSARAHDRAGRRALAGWPALDRMPSRTSSCPCCVLSKLFRRLMLEKLARRARGRQAAVLRRPRTSRRRQGVRRIPRPAQEDALVRLRQAPVRRARRPCSPICRATPTASPSPTAG